MLEQPLTLAERVLEMRLRIQIRPRGQGRPRFDPRFARAYTDKNTRSYVDTIRAAAMEKWGDRTPLEGAVMLTVTAMFAPPARSGKRLYHVQKPDGDNVFKAAADALGPHKVKRELVWNGVFKNDAQVVDGRFRKEWDVRGNAIEINVWSIV